MYYSTVQKTCMQKLQLVWDMSALIIPEQNYAA